MGKISDYAPLDLVKLEFENYAGEVTGEFINVRRIDSDPFRKAMLDYNRSAAEMEASPSDVERGVAMIVALIDSWSFDEGISIGSVGALIKLYPRTTTFPGIDAKILEAATNKHAFVKKKPAVNNPPVSGVEIGQKAQRKQKNHSRAT